VWYRLSGGVVPLLHCNICPASYHVSCLPPTKRASSSALHSSAWTCPSCKSGRKPLYGDIVWVKYSNYRSVENLPAAVAKWVSAYVTWTISLQIDSWSDFGIFKCQLTRVLVVRLSFLRVKWLKRTHTIFGDRAFSAAGPPVWNYMYLPTDLRQPDLLYSRFRRFNLVSGTKLQCESSFNCALEILLLTYLLVIFSCVHRWWPGQICRPESVPLNIRDLPHDVGQFAVYFFGTHDYLWTHHGRSVRS